MEKPRPKDTAGRKTVPCMKQVITIRLLIQGDSHGNTNDILPKIRKAGDLKINHLLVVGDLGLWTHFADGHEFLDEIEEAARINNLSVYAVGGNHENWDHWNWFVENMPTHKGFAMVRRRVLLAPKAHQWRWANKQFVGAGGAVSIDKASRLQRERGRGGPRTLWWPNEELLDADVDKINTFGQADYLITHDCSNYTPWRNRLKPDMDSQIHRRRIDDVLKATQPRFHFHGHMHEKYDWVNEYTGAPTRTIGLEAFQDHDSWGVLDTEQDRWYWPDELESAKADREKRKSDATV